MYTTINISIYQDYTYSNICFQVADINARIRAAPRDSPLYKLPLLEDPSNNIAEVLVKSVEWNMLSREWNLSVSDLSELHKLSKGLLEALIEHLPDRVGGALGWNFEKAHSILHKVREIILWGWSENTSCQGPEHAHIDLIKSVAHLTNNKDVFLCILRYHCRRGLVQQYEQMLEDLLDGNEDAGGESASRPVALDRDKMQQALSSDRNFSVSCELGVRYPVLKALLNRADMHIRTAVSQCTFSIYNKYVYHYYESYMSVFACHMFGIYTVYI